MSISIHTYNQPILGEITLPGDKSISHRSAIFGAIAEGTTTIHNYLMGQDCLSTIKCLQALGVRIMIQDNIVTVEGKGWKGLQAPDRPLDVGNSGTSIRLLAGLLSGRPFTSTLDGDASIRKRPMDRVTIPLSEMGAEILCASEKYSPLVINGGKLKAINYKSPIASAQVKSSVLLAALQAEGTTEFIEPYLSRDHTERMIRSFGGLIHSEKNKVTIEGGQVLAGQSINVPGDISSAAFFIAAAAITPGSHLIIRNVGMNPTRTGFVEVLEQMGADIELSDIIDDFGELSATLTVRYAPLKAMTIEGEWVPKMIDEIPIFALVASQASGQTVIKDASELKIKETNRIIAVVNELSKLGVNINETEDGMVINGEPDRVLSGGTVETYHDHRMAMMLMVASQIAENPLYINDSECVNISFPSFVELFKNVR